MNDCNIIIKPADKGSGIIIWDKQDYLRECKSELTDVNVYKTVEGDQVTTTNKKIRKVLHNMIGKNETDKRLADYRYIKRPELGRFFYCEKFIREQPVYQEELLFPITVQQLKTFRLSLIST